MSLFDKACVTLYLPHVVTVSLYILFPRCLELLDEYCKNAGAGSARRHRCMTFTFSHLNCTSD